MIEARSLLRAARALLERRETFVTATIVRVQGSSYRRPGARLLVTERGREAGSVSGGCLERELVRTAFWLTRGGPVVRRFDSSDPDEPGALGCGGVVDVLVERSEGGESDFFGLLSGAMAAEKRLEVATVFESSDGAIPVGARAWLPCAGLDAPLAGRSHPALARLLFAPGAAARRGEIAAPAGPRGEIAARAAPAEPRGVATESGSVAVLVETIAPPPHLFVLGSGLDALALAAAAARLGWSVTVWEAPASFETRNRLAGAEAACVAGLSDIENQMAASDTPVAVVMGHHLARDRQALRAAAASKSAYIGVLGPRHRTASLAADLPGLLGDPRVHAPVGLDLGAETPDEIAVSIVSEILACLRGGSGDSLRQRATIHRATTR